MPVCAANGLLLQLEQRRGSVAVLPLLILADWAFAGGGCRAMVAYARCGRSLPTGCSTALQRLLLQDNVAQRFNEFFVFFACAHGYAEVAAFFQAANVIELSNKEAVHTQLVFELFYAACA